MTKIYAIAASVAFAALLGGLAGYMWFVKSDDDKFAQCRAGQAAGGSIGGPFTLVDQTGTTVTDKEVLKGPALVYFGYASCPDVCPLDAQRNADVADILAEQGLDLTPVFITIDPARDTPRVLAEWTSAVGPKMIGLTGSAEQIKAAADAYKIFYKKETPDAKSYAVEHTTYSYLMMPGTGFVEFFDRDITAEKLADRVGCFLTAS